MLQRIVDENYRLFGSEALLKRLQALTKEIEGVRNSDDIEYIHRMRVASRRIRSAMLIFGECFPKKKAEQWSKNVKGITRALGAARDTDVQLDSLRNFDETLADPKFRFGIERLILRLRQQREKLQDDVLAALDNVERSGVLFDMEETLRQTLVRARLNDISGYTDLIYERASNLIMLKLEEFLAYEIYVPQQECVVQHHAMRIAAKRLRYTIEIFEPIYGKAIKKPLTIVKDMQEMLGDIHDCDVWTDFLPAFLEQEKARIIDFQGSAKGLSRIVPGIELLVDSRKARRAERYKEFVEFWNECNDQNAWKKLKDTINEARTADEPSETPDEVANADEETED